jgi:hypothetical protein
MTSEIGAHHANPVSTEVQAAEKIGPHLGTLRRTVFDLILKSGDLGMTPDEMIAATGGLDYSIRPRFNDLWDSGLIKRNGAERPNRRGNNESVWVAGEDISRGSVERGAPKPVETPVIVPTCPGCAASGKTRQIPKEAMRQPRSRCGACGTIFTWPSKTSP